MLASDQGPLAAYPFHPSEVEDHPCQALAERAKQEEAAAHTCYAQHKGMQLIMSMPQHEMMITQTKHVRAVLGYLLSHKIFLLLLFGSFFLLRLNFVLH